MTKDEKNLLDDVRHKLGAAQRAMVCEWLRLAMNEEPYGENAGKQKGRKGFAETGYSNDLVNNYAHAEAYARFKAQWKAIRHGERSSVSFAGDASFIIFYSPQHVTIEQRDGDWWLIAPRIYAGRTKVIREQNAALGWRLDPVDNRRRHWTLGHMDAAVRISCVRVMPDRNKSGKWVARVSIELPEIQRIEKREELAAGVDLGINCPAVLSVPNKQVLRFLGNEREQYPRLYAKIRQYEDRKRRLHRAGKHKAGRDLRLNISNVRQHINECISRELVDLCRELRVTVIRLEDLKGLTRHKSTTGKLRYWPRYHLQQRIEQKAAEVGIEVEYVRAAGTSQTCSRCGHMSKENRHGTQFECLDCGLQMHADANAACNIARALKQFGPVGQPPVDKDAAGLRFGGERREPAARHGRIAGLRA